MLWPVCLTTLLVAVGSSKPKEEVKRLPGGKIKKKVMR